MLETLSCMLNNFFYFGSYYSVSDINQETQLCYIHLYINKFCKLSQEGYGSRIPLEILQVPKKIQFLLIFHHKFHTKHVFM